MIASLRGRLAEVRPDWVLVDVGGVGYRCFVPDSTSRTLPSIGGEVHLYVHTYVREDALHLFGFGSHVERELFEAMLAVSGVGPRLALAVLSSLSPDRFVAAILSGESRMLTGVRGVGKKTAERMVLELRDRMKGWQVDDGVQAAPALGGPAHEAQAALVALGYDDDEAAAAVREALADDQDAGVEDVVRAALRRLAR